VGELVREGSDSTALGFETRAIHAGQYPDPATGAVVTSISLSTTFAQDAVGDHKGYEYSRSGNPTRAALEVCLASLENGAHGLAFASGLSAEDAILRALVRPGQRILLGNDAYGGTFRLISKVYEPAGCSWSAGRPHRSQLRWTRPGPDDAVVVWLETPTNPLLTCIDIEAIAAVAHRRRRAGASWTTRLPRRTSSAHSSTARTSSSTRRRSTSAGTPT
jgi:cystathionine gamma-synthase